MMRRTTTQTGFTLIELMIVVGILAILSAVAIVAYTKWTRSAREAEAQSILSDIRIKQEAYRASFRQYAEYSDWAPDDSMPNGYAINWLDAADADVSAAWAQLGLTPSGKHFHFRYFIEAGAPGENSTMFDGLVDTTGDFWFGARAVHDLDEDGKCEGFEIYAGGDLLHRLQPDAGLCP